MIGYLGLRGKWLLQYVLYYISSVSGPAQKRKPQSRPRYSLLYHHEPGVPRYIIPREYDRTDSDDSSYSGDGDLEATHYSDEEVHL